MANRMNLVGTVHKFDGQKYPFASLFLTVLNTRLSASGRKTIPTLDQLHDVFTPENLDEAYETLYAFEERPEFVDIYGRFIEEYVNPLAPGAYFQRKPGVRIHLPRTRTVQYHTDEWYGHGPGVLNCWLPLTRARETNSLYVASLSDSIAETRRLEAEKASVIDIERQLAHIARPLNLDHGEFYIFSSRSVHGTETNSTLYTRVSIDFRLLSGGTDAGAKTLHSYYTHAGDSGSGVCGPANTRYAAAAYLDMRNGPGRYITSDHQRLIIRDFAKKKNIALLAEEMEIQTMSHHPTLQYLAEGKGTHDINSVVLFSVFSLPEDSADRMKIYDKAQASNVVLFFATEDLTFPTNASRSEVEQRRARFLHS
jgi:sporadic carbohydrate cluster protein (TIGR04323 family)